MKGPQLPSLLKGGVVDSGNVNADFNFNLPRNTKRRGIPKRRTICNLFCANESEHTQVFSVTQKVGGFVSKSGKKKKMNKRRSSSQVSVIFVHVIDDLRKHSTVCRQAGEG